jgi:hypothetical protein
MNSKKSSNRTENDFAKKNSFFVNIQNQLMANADGCAVEMLCKCVRRREREKRIILRLISIFQRVEGVHNCYFPIFISDYFALL